MSKVSSEYHCRLKRNCHLFVGWKTYQNCSSFIKKINYLNRSNNITEIKSTLATCLVGGRQIRTDPPGPVWSLHRRINLTEESFVLKWLSSWSQYDHMMIWLLHTWIIQKGSSYKIISNRALDEAQCVRKLIERSIKGGTFFRKKKPNVIYKCCANVNAQILDRFIFFPFPFHEFRHCYFPILHPSLKALHLLTSLTFGSKPLYILPL